jgi:hypothetical protein
MLPPSSGASSRGTITVVPPPSTAYTTRSGSEAQSGSHSLSRQRRSSTLSAKPRKHMQQIASSEHRNLLRCASGKEPLGAATAAAALAAPQPPLLPPHASDSWTNGTGMKRNITVR